MAAVALGSFFDGMYDTAVAVMSANAGALISNGQDLAGVLLLITLSWQVVMWMLSSDGVSALSESLGVITRYSIVAILLAGWVGVVGGFFQANANDLAQRLTGVRSVSETVNLILAGAGRLLVSERVTQESNCELRVPLIPSLPTLATVCLKRSSASVDASAGWLDLANLPLFLVTWLLRLIALLFMGLFLAAYLSVIFMAEILFGIGLTLGPILVPWLIWKQTDWLFDGWLKFMISASLTKVVAAYMVMSTSGLVMGLKTYSESVNTSSGDLLGADEMAALLLCVICAMGTFLMWQVPGIAQALINGGSIAAKGFGGGRMGRATSVKAAASTASNVVNAVIPKAGKK